MSVATEKRVAALESAASAGVGFMLILCHIVKPGVPPGEATQAEMLGQHFERGPTETEADFIERLRGYALADRRPGQYGVQVVLMDETDLDL